MRFLAFLAVLPLVYTFSTGPSGVALRATGRGGANVFSKACMVVQNNQACKNKGAAASQGQTTAAWDKQIVPKFFGAALAVFALSVAPVSVPAEINPSMLLSVQGLPAEWSTSVTEDGKEFYYNTKTGVSQWDPPVSKDGSATKSGPYSKKKGGSGQDLREIVPFQAPEVPIDRVTVKGKVTLKEGCGDTDFRSNSIECGEPARNVIEDTAIKSIGTLETVLQDKSLEGLKERSLRADERARMLQEAEMKSLANTELFKRLDKQTKDPERAAARKKEIEEITARNDIGAQKAPWASDDDPVGPPPRMDLPEIKLPELKLPELKLPF